MVTVASSSKPKQIAHCLAEKSRRLHMGSVRKSQMMGHRPLNLDASFVGVVGNAHIVAYHLQLPAVQRRTVNLTFAIDVGPSYVNVGCSWCIDMIPGIVRKRALRIASLSEG